MDDDVDQVIRRAIAGEWAAIDQLLVVADTTDEVRVLVVAAILAPRVDLIERARTVATTSRARQTVAIASTYARGDAELVAMLARDHLSEHPDNLVVAWIASIAPLTGGRVPPRPA